MTRCDWIRGGSDRRRERGSLRPRPRRAGHRFHAAGRRPSLAGRECALRGGAHREAERGLRSAESALREGARCAAGGRDAGGRAGVRAVGGAVDPGGRATSFPGNAACPVGKRGRLRDQPRSGGRVLPRRPSVTRARRAPCGMHWPRGTRRSRRCCIHSENAMLSSLRCSASMRRPFPYSKHARAPTAQLEAELRAARSESRIACRWNSRRARGALASLTGGARPRPDGARRGTAGSGYGESAGRPLIWNCSEPGNGGADSIKTYIASGTTAWTPRAPGTAPCRPNATG